MAKFYVGQRVRILYSNNWPELKDQQGRITDSVTTFSKTHPSFRVAAVSEWIVAPDAWGSCFSPRVGFSDGNGPNRCFAPNSSQLEPIVGNFQACDEEFKQEMDKLLTQDCGNEITRTRVVNT